VNETEKILMQRIVKQLTYFIFAPTKVDLCSVIFTTFEWQKGFILNKIRAHGRMAI
jgi:hypothetical protein